MNKLIFKSSDIKTINGKDYFLTRNNNCYPVDMFSDKNLKKYYNDKIKNISINKK